MKLPELTFPPEIADHVRETYAQARVILEYGSGGSTWLAAQMPGKTIFSVESDAEFARDMRRLQARMAPPSPAVIYPVDIGPTGAWGRPRSDRHWQKFHHYPLRIWDEPFFEQPDVILIDGRFRPACLMTALMRTQRPVKVLFDDYVDRPQYHVVERMMKPVLKVGRMAQFHVEPGSIPPEHLSLVIGLFSQTTYAKRPRSRVIRPIRPARYLARPPLRR